MLPAGSHLLYCGQHSQQTRGSGGGTESRRRRVVFSWSFSSSSLQSRQQPLRSPHRITVDGEKRSSDSWALSCLKKSYQQSHCGDIWTDFTRRPASSSHLPEGPPVLERGTCLDAHTVLLIYQQQEECYVSMKTLNWQLVLHLFSLRLLRRICFHPCLITKTSPIFLGTRGFLDWSGSDSWYRNFLKDSIRLQDKNEQVDFFIQQWSWQKWEGLNATHSS